MSNENIRHYNKPRPAGVETSAITAVVLDPSPEEIQRIESQHQRHAGVVIRDEEAQQQQQQQQDKEEGKKKILTAAPVSELDLLPSFADACVDVVRLVLPMVATNIATFGINRTVCMMIVGQTLTVRDISIMGTGIVLYNCMAVSFPTGFVCAVDTLVSQANGRNPNGSEAGMYMQTGIVVILMMCVPIAIFFLFFVEPLLALIFTAPNFAADLATFLKYCIPFMFCQNLNITLSRALQAQKRADLPTIAAICGTITFVIIGPILIPHGGVFFAPLCLGLATLVQVIATFTLCFFFDKKKKKKEKEKNEDDDSQQQKEQQEQQEIDKDTSNNIFTKVPWNLFDCTYWTTKIASWDRIKEFSAVGFPSAMAIVSEWVAMECLILLGAGFPPAELAALNVIWINIALMFCVALSFSVGASAFVGNHLGRNEPEHANFYSEAVQVCLGAMLLLDSLFLTVAGSWWFGLFTTDSTTLAYIEMALACVVVFHNIQSWHIGLQGIFRGCGWQDYCAKVVTVSLWLIGLPCAYFFGLVYDGGSADHYNFLSNVLGIPDVRGVRGLFYGFCVGFVIEISFLIYGWKIVPWKELAVEASLEKRREELILLER